MGGKLACQIGACMLSPFAFAAAAACLLLVAGWLFATN
jgi:hypothetical protein